MRLQTIVLPMQDALIGPGFLYVEQKEWLTQAPCFLI